MMSGVVVGCSVIVALAAPSLLPKMKGLAGRCSRRTKQDQQNVENVAKDILPKANKKPVNKDSSLKAKISVPTTLESNASSVTSEKVSVRSDASSVTSEKDSVDPVRSDESTVGLDGISTNATIQASVREVIDRVVEDETSITNQVKIRKKQMESDSTLWAKAKACDTFAKRIIAVIGYVLATILSLGIFVAWDMNKGNIKNIDAVNQLNTEDKISQDKLDKLVTDEIITEEEKRQILIGTTNLLQSDNIE